MRTLVIMFVTQGMVNGIILVGDSSEYIAVIAPPGCKSLAITSYYIIGGNISTISLPDYRRRVVDAFGRRELLTFSGGTFNLVGVCLYIIFKLYKPDES